MASDEDTAEVTRRTSTPMHNMTHDAARAVGLVPEKTELVDVDLMMNGELQMYLRGPVDD